MVRIRSCLAARGRRGGRRLQTVVALEWDEAANIARSFGVGNALLRGVKLLLLVDLALVAGAGLGPAPLGV